MTFVGHRRHHGPGTDRPRPGLGRQRGAVMANVPEGPAMRYVVLAIHDQAKWIVLFPDFPDLVATGFLLQEALRKAQQELSRRAILLQWLGTPLPMPMSAAALVKAPCFSYSMPAIITVPGPWEQENVVRFGGV